MKIIKPIILLAFLCSMAFGQDTTRHKLIIGAHGGPAGATLIGFDEFLRGWIKFKPRLGYVAGINFQYSITPKFILCLEANYESKGFIMVDPDAITYDYSNPNTPEVEVHLGRLRIEYINDYITMPLTARIILNSSKKTAWYFNTGLYTAYLVKSLSVLRSVSNEYPPHFVPGDSYRSDLSEFRTISRINLGLITGIGVSIPFKERFQFSIEARNNLRFGNIFKYKQDESFALLFGLGYKLK